MTWNTRGAGGASSHRLISDIIDKQGVNLFALLEPRQAGIKAKLLAWKIGWSNMHVVDAQGFSGGIWLFWDSSCNFSIISAGEQFVHGMVNAGNDNEWSLTIVYGHPNIYPRRLLWSSLRDISQVVRGGWLVVGDFNAVSCPEDRWSMKIRETSGVDRFFWEWITDTGLIDIGFSGPRFTWGTSSSQSRIDRALVDGRWHAQFPNASVLHLPKYKSDHCPILVNTDKVAHGENKQRPFRFFAPWVMHDEFSDFVKQQWNVKEDWCGSLENFTEQLKIWNKEVFGNLIYMKNKLYRRLDGINTTIARVGPSVRLENLQCELWKELEKILAQEEIMWIQYSRATWYIQGDRNTRYFHSKANGRRRRNRILALKLDSQEWSYDEQEIREFGSNFFEDLYTEMSTYQGSLVFGCTYPEIDTTDRCALGRQVDEMEIKRALFDMGSLKAPGPDGLNPLFYQSQWDTVGLSVTSLVKRVFSNPDWVHNINDTQIVLIPKIDHPQSFRDFRPISLCNVVYKIVTKIISNRFKSIMPLVVAPNQCSFVKGRQSTDNIILV